MHPGVFPADRPAIVMADSGQVITHGELHAAATRIARVFRAMGLQPGDHVALCLENRAEFLELAWGAHYAGLLYTACSTRLTVEELGYIVDDCGARAFVLSPAFAELAEGVAAITPKVERRLSLGGAVPGHEPLEALTAGESAEPLAEDPWIAGRDMLYSSGTTGRPKGIRPKELVDTMDVPMMISPVLQGFLGMGEGAVYLSPAPLYHAAPLRFCMAVHQLGGTTVVMEKWDERRCLELIAEHRVTHAQFVPTMFVRLLRLPEEVRAAADVSSLQAVVHAAAPCPADVKRAMIEWWGPIVNEYYASTEGAGLTWITSEDWLAHPGTVGRAVIGTPHIVDAEGNDVPTGETGAVWFADGPPFEYHNDPEKTAESHDERGWATFGDIGHLDADGFLYLTDRASYMIISGGVNIYPQEAEDALLAHEDVLDAAVFGIPDPDFGESVKAVVQPREMPADDTAAAALEARLLEHCRGRLAHLKCPRSIDFRPELPRTETGKLFKRVLKEEYARQAAGSAA